ncbi:procollagen-lysine 5-dioxygenase [Aureococcus anophagefferens]|nr:procollagen-lysine 5-dioxygenase [Aureococcus anophagefferens]
MAALVEASALQPWAVLKAFAGGVARGEDTAFEWDPPDAPKSCTSWNEAVHGAEPLALLEGEARENFATAPKRPPAQFKSFRDFAIKLNSQERSNKRARPMLFVGGCHRSGTSVLARLLKRSPLVAGMEDTDAPEDEGQHLQHVLPTDEEHGGVGCFALRRKVPLDGADDGPGPRRLRRAAALQLGQLVAAVEPAPGPVRAAGRRHAAAAPREDAEQHRAHAAAPGGGNGVIRRRFNVSVSWLRRAFGPAARFLIIVRHPLACALATREFLKEFESPTPTLRTCLRNWVAAHAALDEDAVELRRMALLDDVRHGSGDACLLRIAFSDLVRDPAAVLERIGAELVDAPLHVAAEDVAAVVKEGDPDDKYRAMWREWPDRPFRWDENGTFELGSDKPAPPARREAGAAGIVAEFTEPLARLGFPRAFKDDWARTPPPEPAD